MKKLCYKRWVKTVAAIMAILMGNLIIASVVITMACEGENVYDQPMEKVCEQKFEDILRDYSIVAMNDYQDDFAKEELEKTNFRYAIIQTDSIREMDLTDTSKYIVNTLEGEVKEEDLQVYSCNVGESSTIIAGKNLWDSFYISNNGRLIEESHRVEKCYYVRDLQELYFLADNGVLYYVQGYVPNETEIVASTETNASYHESAAEGEEMAESASDVPVDWMPETAYRWEKPNDTITIANQLFYYSDIEITKLSGLKEMEIVDSQSEGNGNYQNYEVQNGQVITYREVYEQTEPYFVLSYVKTPLEQFEGAKPDLFIQMNWYLEVLYTMRYSVYGILIAALILMFASVIVLCTGAGHSNGNAELRLGGIDKIPLDVFVCIIGGICFLLLFLEAACMEFLAAGVSILTGCTAILAAEILVELFCYSFLARIKIGKWWRNTLCYRLFAGVIKAAKKCIHLLPMMWKAWLIMGVMAFFEFMAIIIYVMWDVGVVLFFWLIEKVVVYGGVTVCLLQMKTLQQASEQIAQGDLESHINTDKMFFELKKHGENLNNIRTGMNQAVEEQIKSERFKTELITNVSHDIKTPLTSIINYVDLLEKENIENPTEKEYLEVLSRQSARLKKLIEDLMEASKASTGNLTVSWENCDAGVILTQTVGEFEEKLKANGIDLIVDCKETILIAADPRHLWRIMENLMNNISKYAQPSTRAYVNVEKQGENCRIIFRNISKYPLNIGSEELMERFVRGDSSRNTEGSGLGLSIARSLTELMKGTFTLIIDGDLFKVEIMFPTNEKRNGKDLTEL